jgi:hypothetical protein
MIESLAEHGVLAADLVPALMTTHTVKNPEYDPTAAGMIAEEEEPEEATSSVEDRIGDKHHSSSDPFGDSYVVEDVIPPPPYSEAHSIEKKGRTSNPFGDEDEGDIGAMLSPKTPARNEKETVIPVPDLEEGDIAASLQDLAINNGTTTPKAQSAALPPETPHKPTTAAEVVEMGLREEGPKHSEALPGVSTALSKTDENVTLDIRWTVVSDQSISLFDVAAIERVVNSFAICSCS